MSDELVLAESKTLVEAPPPALHRAIAQEYLRDFNLSRVAEMFGTTPMGVRLVVNDPNVRSMLMTTVGDVSSIADVSARRLVEALLEEAMGDKESKGRTEARKLLARHFLPLKKEVKNEHIFYVETPGKMTADEWAQKYGQNDVPVLDAEVLDDDDT